MKDRYSKYFSWLVLSKQMLHSLSIHFFVKTNCVTMFPVCPPNAKVLVGISSRRSNSVNNDCILVIMRYFQ